MATATLRKWGGAIAVSLPKKVLGLLDLTAGCTVNVTAEDGKIVLSPAREACSLETLLEEQEQLERTLGYRLIEQDWIDDRPRGKEAL